MDEFRLAPLPPSTAEPRERGGGIPIGRLFGVPIRLAPSWLFLAVLITLAYGQLLSARRDPVDPAVGFGIGFGFVVCLLVSVLLHELGHAVTSRRSGIGVLGITLEMLGGYTEMEHEPPRPSIELYVSLAGPAVSLVLGLLSAGAALLLPDRGIAQTFALQLALSNIVVAVFNVLPGLPLDGGRALQATIWAITGDPNLGRRVAGWSGRLVAVLTLVVAGALYASGVLVGLFGLVFTALVALTLWVGAGQAIRQGRVGARLPRLDAAELARPIMAVGADTPLAEAERLARASGLADPAIAVVDPAGNLVALVYEPSAAAVPEPRRPWVTIGEVSRSLDPAHVLPGHLRGIELLRAIKADPAGDYLVVSGEDVRGVLRGAELVSLIEPRRLLVRRNAT